MEGARPEGAMDDIGSLKDCRIRESAGWEWSAKGEWRNTEEGTRAQECVSGSRVAPHA